MASGWFHRAKRVGPISEHDLLIRIDQGKLHPETLVQSQKTRNRWVPMSVVGPAMQRWREIHPDAELPGKQQDQPAPVARRPQSLAPPKTLAPPHANDQAG